MKGLHCSYALFQRFYIATSRQLKRLDSVSLSPIYSHFSETITGASSIRAYRVINQFIKESERKVDYSQTCNFPMMISNRYVYHCHEDLDLGYKKTLFAKLREPVVKQRVAYSKGGGKACRDWCEAKTAPWPMHDRWSRDSAALSLV